LVGKRELENYYARPYLLVKYAKLLHFKYEKLSSTQLEQAMNKAIEDFTLRAYLNDLNHNWWNTAKLSDDWLDNIFPEFYKQLNLPLGFYKRHYYQLIALMDIKDISDEIVEKLDLIYETLK
jgi:hypothetical protein